MLAGFSHDPESLSNHTSLVRLNANGSLDASFGDGGKLIVPVSSTDDRAWSVMQQTDGKLVMVGYSASAGTGDDFSVVRLNPDGSLDSSFGTLGKATIPVSNAADAAWGIVQQPDGKLVLGGYTECAARVTTTVRCASTPMAVWTPALAQMARPSFLWARHRTLPTA